MTTIKKQIETYKEKHGEPTKAIDKFIKKHRRHPPIFTPRQIKILEEAFKNDLNNEEARILAGICRTNFYYYIEAYPEFADKIKALKTNMRIKAKYNLAEAVKEGDLQASQWLLKHTAPDEYNTATQLTGKDGKDLIPEVVRIIDDIDDKGNKQKDL